MNKSLILATAAGLLIAPLVGYVTGQHFAARAPLKAQIVVYDMESLLRKAGILPEQEQAQLLSATRDHIAAMAAEGVIVLDPKAVRAAGKDFMVQ